MESELGLKTQNSGVVVKSDEHTGNVDYFGWIRRILEIQYMNNKSVILFQCDWFEVPPQGRMYYVKHGQSEKWHSTIRVRPRNLYDLPEQKDEMEPYQLIDLVERGETSQEVELENDNIKIEREDIDGVSVEAPSLNNEEEVDLVVVDEPDHENVDDFSDSSTDEDTSEYDEPIMMQNMHISNDTETVDVGAIPPSEKKRKGRGKTTELSTQKKHKESDNEKLKVIIPPDRTVLVGPGAKDFITELSVKVLHNARQDVKNWKGVPDLAKNWIVAYMLAIHHDHFKKFATKEESLQNIPTDVNEAEWKFLVDYSSSDDFKDKVKDVVAEKIQEIEEGTDVDPIINAAFVQIMGEKSKYILGQGSGIKSATQQKEVEEERRKQESVETKLIEVKNQLEEEQKNREVMEVRFVHDQKLLKDSMMALVSHMQNPNMQKELDNLKDILTFEKQNLEMTIYDCDKFSSLCNEKDVELKASL
ncbi:hypothetical protein H5410_056766 [Solanum commersonii]|uniref:DUF4216 domain-containing protein n=1 Tax=Solanum commersonii TaxID=4109 RepID=A0A9J5WNM3_SOLCO|nr:hypothetical protein H5410_056766 [Solanum commersonii]